MDKELDSVCPVFIRDGDEKIDQIGSGVLLKIKEKTFLLTAAHVCDWSEKGELCIPTKNGIESIIGYCASILAPKKLGRNKDIIDIAYFLLDGALVEKIHDSFRVLSRNECWLTDNLLSGDIYTFSGFPLTKAKKSRNNEFSSELFSYSGEAAIPDKYKNLKYSEDSNIIINFRRKKAIAPTGEKRVPPHPKGISGGAIFRWPKSIGKNVEVINRSLVGIGHTYIERHNCLIGTKLSLYFNLIINNHPELFKSDTIHYDNSTPMFMALIFYRKDEWELLMSQFDDADNMQNSWEEWRNAAEYGVEHMDRNNKLIIPIELSAKEINEYCKLKKLPNTGRSRVELVNKKLFEMLKESKVV